MFRLQKVIFPSVLDSSELLYYRAHNQVAYSAQLTATIAYKTMRFDTYFNMFSLRTWKTYTAVTNVFLELRMRGKCRVRLYALDSHNREEQLAEHALDVPEMTTVRLPFPETDAQMLFWTLERGDDLFFEEAWYACDVPENARRDVHIAVVTCTFRREAYIRKNVPLLQSVPDLYPDLAGRMSIHIVDNGRTLRPGEFERHDTFLHPNPNVGGAGGFARGILEALDRHDGTTHIMLMDDDVAFLPESLFRAFRLLEFCRPEYHGAFLGGAMLDARKKHIQHANAEYLNTDVMFVRSVHPGYDLSERHLCLANDTVEQVENQYHAWWFFLFPVQAVEDRGLPYPFFVRLDDVEFSLRKPMYLLYVNGICLWHEPFYTKASNFFIYLHLRNMFILGSLHYQAALAKGPLIKQWVFFFLEAILSFDYKTAGAVADAVEDFLRGPEQFKDPAFGERILQEQRRNQETEHPLEEFPEVSRPVDLRALEHTNRLKGLRRLLAGITLNGNLLPPCLRKRKTGLLLSYAPIRLERIFLCEKILVINRFSGTAIVRTASFRQCMHALFRHAAVAFRYLRDRKKAQKAYQREYQYMTSSAFWREYLGMPPRADNR